MTELFDQHPAGVAVIDADGTLSWLNAAFTRLVARRADDLRGAEFVAVLADLGAKPAAINALRRLIDGSRRGLYEAEIDGADGRARWLCFSVAPPAPDAAGVTLVCQDVTRYRGDAARSRRRPPAITPGLAKAVAPGTVEADDAVEEELSDPPRILLAEDDRSNRLLVLAILQNVGYLVDSVVTGAEVLRALKRGAYDLVLMDIQMPDMDGLQATAEIRAFADPRARVPIIAITAHVMRGSREACLAAGMDDYLAKPFTPAALLDITARWLRKATSEVEAAGSLVSLVSAGDAAGPAAGGDWPPSGTPPGTSMARLREAIDEGDLDALQRAVKGLGPPPAGEPD
jgi:CheY-like chemotaxis protein